MSRAGPGTTLKLRATITYVFGGRETSQDLEAQAVVYGSDKLPELVWQALAGKRAGHEELIEPAEPFSMEHYLDHEVFEVPRSSFPQEPRVSGVVVVPQDDGREVTMTVLKVEAERVLVSPNPFASHPVKRARIKVVEIAGGFLLGGDEIDPTTTVRMHALELADGGSAVRLSRAPNGNVALSGGVAVNDGSNTGIGRGVWLWHPGDPNHVIYSASPGGRSPGDRECTRGQLDAGHRFRLRTYASGQGFLFENSDEQALIDIDSRNGQLWAKGAVFCGNSDLYFTKTDHEHTGIGNAEGHAAIENSSNYGALMILGRTVQANPLRRVVKVWDELSVEGDFMAARMLNPSDARDKQRVEDLDRGLAELERLRPVSFEWKHRANEGKVYGLLGQEVREVISEVVQQGHDDGKLQVSYVELIPVLINAVKQLSAKVATLEAQLAAR